MRLPFLRVVRIFVTIDGTRCDRISICAGLCCLPLRSDVFTSADDFHFGKCQDPFVAWKLDPHKSRWLAIGVSCHLRSRCCTWCRWHWSFALCLIFFLRGFLFRLWLGVLCVMVRGDRTFKSGVHFRLDTSSVAAVAKRVRAERSHERDCGVGFDRVENGTPDIGAYETRNFDVNTLADTDNVVPNLAALSLREVTGQPIKFVGTGEKLENLDQFHPDRMAQRILNMGDVVSLVEKAAEAVSIDEAQRLEEKMRKGTFTLDDFLMQLREMKKMVKVGVHIFYRPHRWGDGADEAGWVKLPQQPEPVKTAALKVPVSEKTNKRH